MTLTPGATAARLANLQHVLREAMHVTAGRLPLEPRLEAKTALAAHLDEDARAACALQQRLAELGADPIAPPGDELRSLLDTGDVYGALKPALLATARAHLQELDPLADEPTHRLLTRLAHRQERHLAELATESHDAKDVGPLPPGDDARPLPRLPPLDAPARDAFVVVQDEPPPDGEDPARAAHDLLDAKLCAAELLARTSHEHPDRPLAFHADLARAAHDAARHAELLDRHLTQDLQAHWGAHPVAFTTFREVYARDLRGRLEALARARTSFAPGKPVFDHVRADEEVLARTVERWSG